MPERITSRQNPRVKAALRLRERRHRQSERRFLVDGAREICRAAACEVDLLEAFVCEELCRTAEAEEAVAVCRRLAAELFTVTPEVFERLAFGDRREGVVVVAQSPAMGLATLSLPSTPLVAVLEGIEKPGNVGAVLRSADAAGIDAVIVADGVTDLLNPNTIRASLGAVFTRPVAAATSGETARWLRQRGFHIYAARVEAAIDFRAADFTGSAAIVLGAESTGLGDVWRGDDVTAISLPMRGVVDSLNVSVTAGVLFYEALRQRG